MSSGRLRKAVSIAAGATMALGASFVIAPSEASAHHFDNYSHYYCAKHRSPGTVIVHSLPTQLQPNYIRYYCRQDFFGVQDQYEVFVDLPLSSDNSTRPFPMERCYPAPAWNEYCLEP